MRCAQVVAGALSGALFWGLLSRRRVLRRRPPAGRSGSGRSAATEDTQNGLFRLWACRPGSFAEALFHRRQQVAPVLLKSG